jgi:hypothetical protein
VTPDLFRKLAALGLSTDQMAGVLEIMEADAETRKSKARARVQKWRDKQPRNVTKHNEPLPNISERLTGGDARGEDNPLTKNSTGKEEKKDTLPSARVALDAFKAELAPILDAERIEALCAVRRKKGATFSAVAARGLAKALRACPNPTEAADEMVLRNWTGIKPEWLENRRANGPPRRQQGNAVEANIARRIRRNEPGGGRLDNGDAELLPPDGTELRSVVGNLGKALSRPFGSSDH